MTGASNLDLDEVSRRLDDIRSHTDAPVGVGFGIDSPESAAAVARVADAVIVGSALVRIVAENAADLDQAVASARTFVSGLHEAIEVGRQGGHQSGVNWFERILPPKVKSAGSGNKRGVPEGLWTKCTSCGAVLYRAELDRNQEVCPKCGQHLRISAVARLTHFLDDAEWEEIAVTSSRWMREIP